ncbi:hypothetical protein [Tsuneonella sp. HG222]
MSEFVGHEQSTTAAGSNSVAALQGTGSLSDTATCDASRAAVMCSSGGCIAEQGAIFS